MRTELREAVQPLVVALWLASLASADEIFLKGGGRVSGRIVERTDTRVAIETGPGRVTLPMSRVERVVESRSALEAFDERASGLAAGDADGWAALARWAGERDLITQARLAWQRVLFSDPGHPEANAALGRVSLDGEWMSAEDAYRARGYVMFEGRWLTPAEHEAAMREQAAEQAARLEARESDLRVREAEARAREAEARAQEAQADDSSGGIPLWYAYGGGYGGYGGGHGGYGPGYPGRGRGGRPPGEWRQGGPRPGAPGHSPAPPSPHRQQVERTAPPASPPPQHAPRSQAGILPPRSGAGPTPAGPARLAGSMAPSSRR